MAEELWSLLGNKESISSAEWPNFNAEYLVDDQITYPVSVNGKTRFSIELNAELSKAEIEQAALAHEEAQKWLEGKAPKRVIVVPKRIVNIVV